MAVENYLEILAFLTSFAYNQQFIWKMKETIKEVHLSLPDDLITFVCFYKKIILKFSDQLK